MDVDARNAETVRAILRGVATSPKFHSPPEGTPASKSWRRLQVEGIAETRSLSDPGACLAIVLPNAGGAAAAESTQAIPQGQHMALPDEGDLSIVFVQGDLQLALPLQLQGAVAQANPSQ
jgi:hypothetical protein